MHVFKHTHTLSNARAKQKCIWTVWRDRERERINNEMFALKSSKST